MNIQIGDVVRFPMSLAEEVPCEELYLVVKKIKRWSKDGMDGLIVQRKCGKRVTVNSLVAKPLDPLQAAILKVNGAFE